MAGSPLILLSKADQGKVFHAYDCQAYYKVGVVRGHIDPIIIAAMCFSGAMARGCEEIEIALEGMRPRRYTLRSVWENICKDPEKFKGIYRPAPKSLHELNRERIYRRYIQPSTALTRAF